MNEPTKWEEIRSTVRPATWSDLLRHINAEVFASDEITQNPTLKLVESGWLGHPGASPTEIEATETRLGMPIPHLIATFLEPRMPSSRVHGPRLVNGSTCVRSGPRLRYDLGTHATER